MPLRDLNEDRDIRVGALLLGHIKLGIFNGRHPQALETYRFTSGDRARLEPLAEDYGGEIRPFRAQGAGTDTWEVITERDNFTATFPFPDAEWNMTQDWKLWKRSGLQRICDGYNCTVYSVVDDTGEREGEQMPCVCSAQNERQCEADTRIRFLLPRTGLGVWELHTGSTIAAQDLHDQYLAIRAVADGRMNQLPLRAVYGPREIAYIEDGQRHTTTARLVSLSIAGDALDVLRALSGPPQEALLSAVKVALYDAGHRELGAPVPSPALTDGGDPSVPTSSDDYGEGSPGREAPTEGKGAGGIAVSPPASDPESSAGDEASARGKGPPPSSGVDTSPTEEDPDLDGPATTVQWERAAAVGLKGSPRVLKLARELFPEQPPRTASAVTKRQMAKVIVTHVERSR